MFSEKWIEYRDSGRLKELLDRMSDDIEVRAALNRELDTASLIYFAYGQAAADHYLETGETPASRESQA